MKKSIRITLIVVLSAVFLLSGYKVLSILDGYRQADALYESVQQEYIQPVVVPTQSVEQKPVKSEVPIEVDFPGLLKKNQDVVGWLYCPDTVVNYPVVQADDNKTYLHKDLSGQYLRSGTLFADAGCRRPGEERNYIVFGHSMKNGSMFGMLLKYKKQSFYDAHPVWYYLTPDGHYRIELVTGCVVHTDRDIYTSELNSKVMLKELSVLKDMSTFRSDVTYTDQDAFITLSTCSYEFDNARFVLVGKLVPIE